MSDWLKASGLALGLTLALLTGCEQGEGEICQVDNDCEIGLSCNATTGLCQSDTTGPTVDAPPAPTPDAQPATPDAPPVTPDAAPPMPDAASADAAP